MPGPANLCQFDLPSGKLCRQVALKGESICRHHMRPFRHDLAKMLHEEAMDRLDTELAALDVSDLLRVLQQKLARLKGPIRGNAEARVALAVTLERLRQGPEVFEMWPPENPTESMKWKTP